MGPFQPVAVVLLLGLPALATQTNPGSLPGNGYIDSKVCATCHRDIAANYARTGMGRSFYKPAAVNTIRTMLRRTPTGIPLLAMAAYLSVDGNKAT